MESTGTGTQDPNPISIPVSQEEIKKGKLSQRNLELAIRALHHDGLVVLEDVILDHGHLDHLNERMVQDAMKLKALGDQGPYNFVRGNLQQNPPPTLEYFHKDIFLNPIVLHVTSTHLGSPPRWAYSSSNVALPTDPASDIPPQSQPTHSDAYFEHPTHPFALVISVPLIKMTPENGSTEVWLGTHEGFDSRLQEAGTSISNAGGGIGDERKAARRKIRPEIQPVVKKGSVILRDIRLWHGGKPNLTNEARVMLSMVHFAPWYRNSMRMPVVETLKETIDSVQGLEIPAEYISEEQALKTYLDRAFGGQYDFTQAP
ncbi:putative phytanoyl-CoA dioxygenase [Xylogone sp. PMI_703]|nr:putative phytanoyl-CoA dioxygenase [Xylogone sp. PMI_703]